MNRPLSIAVIGGGPAGLKAAETAVEAGANVTLYDAKRSVGRKFLIAGKSGLNLTSDEVFDKFVVQYSASNSSMPSTVWQSLLSDFDSTATRSWAKTLGIDTFVSSAKKVFPEQMKAAPLLRRWVTKIKNLGVEFKVNHRLEHLSVEAEKCQLHFSTPEGNTTVNHDRVILAMGGGSWPQTGSTGGWTKIFEELGIQTIPLTAANCGWTVDWSPQLLDAAEGLPLKNIEITSNSKDFHGELVITRYGLEGGPVYRLGPQIRQCNEISIDLKPTFTEQALVAKMESVKSHFLEQAKVRWKLNPAAFAILKFYHKADAFDVEQLANLVKHCRIQLIAPRPIDEAISSAGGIAWSQINENLQVIKYPNLFVAGEMIDWEAPTGGFLLQGCLATGYRAAHSATTK